MIKKMEEVKNLLFMKELEKIFDLKKIIMGIFLEVETMLLFETGNNELIEQGFRYDTFEDNRFSCYIDYPVSIDLRIGVFSVFKSKQCYDMLKPVIENVLLVFSETYSDDAEGYTRNWLWEILCQMMETVKLMNIVKR